MKIENVLIISKMTELEFDEFKYGAAVDEYHSKNNIDVKRLGDNHKYHHESLDNIIRTFENSGINPGIIRKQGMERSDFRTDWDLIVPVGGDGTFMDVARYVLDDTLVWGIKSSPNSVGGHYSTNFSNAEEHIKKILEGEYNVEKRTRVMGTVNNEFSITDHALNEIFVGDIYSPGYAKLDVLVNGVKYETGSSGIVVSTYKGKTGWYDNIPIVEKDPAVNAKYNNAHRDAGLAERPVFDIDSDFKDGEEDVVRYKLREIGKKSGQEYGILKEGEELKIISGIFLDGAVSFDGNKPTRPRHRVYDLHFGNEVVIKISDKPLYVVNAS